MSNIQLSKERIEELELAEFKLQCLEQGGVDNWDFYDDSLENYYKRQVALEKKKEHLKKLTDYFDEIEGFWLEGMHEPAGSGCGYGIRPEASAEAFEVFKRIIENILEQKK